MSLSLWITLGVAILVGAVTVGMFANSRSPKTLTTGLGLTMLPVGLYLFGLTDLMVNGIESIIAWAQRTTFDTTMTVGAVLLGLGVVFLIVGGFMKAKPRQERQQQVQSRPQPPAAGGGTPRPGVTAGKPVAKPAPQKKAGEADGENDEIEEILRRRGIM